MAELSNQTSPLLSDTVLAANCIDEGSVERLKQAVRSAGGHASVSRKSGVTSRSLSRYLAGDEMKVSALIAIAGACGVALEWLATGRGPMRPVEAQDTQKAAAPPIDRRLFPNVSMDLMAEAITETLLAVRERKGSPDPRQLAQLICLHYDQLLESLEADVQGRLMAPLDALAEALSAERPQSK